MCDLFISALSVCWEECVSVMRGVTFIKSSSIWKGRRLLPQMEVHRTMSHTPELLRSCCTTLLPTILYGLQLISNQEKQCLCNHQHSKTCFFFLPHFGSSVPPWGFLAALASFLLLWQTWFSLNLFGVVPFLTSFHNLNKSGSFIHLTHFLFPKG